MSARASRLALAALVAASAVACASEPRRMYAWGGYDEVLVRHYRQPQDRQAFVRALKQVVANAERRGQSAPPGIYAEYGYALYEEGQYPAAVAYFEKERTAWPESALLMDKMIRNAGARAVRTPAGQPSGRGPAGELERTR
jgi:hypothetical protein